MHPDDFYNGCYYQTGYWNGYPHLENENGAHLYFYDSYGTGYWQLDDYEQDGTNDWSNGGYFKCGDREDWDSCGAYDQEGADAYEWSIGDIIIENHYNDEDYSYLKKATVQLLFDGIHTARQHSTLNAASLSLAAVDFLPRRLSCACQSGRMHACSCVMC